MENNNPEEPSEKGKLQTAFEKAAKSVKAFFWRDGLPKKRGVGLVLALVLSYLMKRKVYNRLIPASDVTGLLLKSDIKSVSHGHF